jgi:hypothetical protein
MSFHQRRTVDDAFDIQPDSLLTARLMSSDESNVGVNGLRRDSPTSDPPVIVGDALEPAQGAGDRSNGYSDFDLPEVTLPRASSRSHIQHVDNGGRILDISSLSQSTRSVTPPWRLILNFCTNFSALDQE